MRYILWVENGRDGWVPEFYEDEEKLIKALKKPHYGDIILTKEIKIIISGD